MSCQHEITITNFKCGQTVSYPLLIIKGAVENHDSDSCNCEEIHVKKSTTSSFKVVSGEFKAFLEVEQGQNEIIFFFCGTKLKITLNYQPRDTKFTVLPLYIICEGHDGEFQAPPTEESTVTSAIRRITVASKLIQSAIADILHESGKERKTFQLERDCVVFQSRLHYLVARKMSQEELWETLAKEISTSNWDVANTKFLGFLSCTWYCGANPAVDLTHEDIIKRTQAHVALGGGGLGLFGTACLYTWPENLEQVLERFENTTSVDKDKFMDQSGCRGTLGACFSTTLGAALHELCHTLDLGHTREGIMARGFEDVDKIFTVNEKREKNPRLKRLVERRKEFYVNGKDGGHGAFFTRSSLMILAYHRWLNNFEPSNKTIKYDASTKLVSSRAGLRVIELRQEEDSMVLSNWIFDSRILKYSFQIPENEERLILFIEDNCGNVFKDVIK